MTDSVDILLSLGMLLLALVLLGAAVLVLLRVVVGIGDDVAIEIEKRLQRGEDEDHR